MSAQYLPTSRSDARCLPVAAPQTDFTRTEMLLGPPLSIVVSEATVCDVITAPPTSLCTSRTSSPLDGAPWSTSPTPCSLSEAGMPECGVPETTSGAALPESLKKHKWKADEDALLARLVAQMAAAGGKVRWSSVGAHAL